MSLFKVDGKISAEGNNFMKNITAIILAAGEGTRMYSQRPKILHKICGQPMIDYVVNAVRGIGIKKIIIVVGHKSQLVEDHLSKDVITVKQKKLLGTGDAVMSAKSNIGLDDELLILYGDTPLVTSETLKELLKKHRETAAACTLLTAVIKNPSGYGRVLRDDSGKIQRIVEENDATLFQKVVEEINVGVYFYKAKDLFEALAKIRPLNKKNEYYLTDTISLLIKKNKQIASIRTENNDEILGINSRRELSVASRIIKMCLIEKIVDCGVTVVDPDNTYIEVNVTASKDTVIYPFTYIEQDVTIGKNCIIGPFVRIRRGTTIGNDTIVGNFVELNRSEIGNQCRIKHQSYLGDTLLEDEVNIGAGTVVANYDGKNKHKTKIKKGAFIGCGTILVAPVTIGKSAVTGAGTVVPKNKDVADNTVVVGVPARTLKKKENGNA
ncbi:MAG: sugar phosphate nucleotidyltransferase [Candidatus Omnitrophota bacterium]